MHHITRPLAVVRPQPVPTIDLRAIQGGSGSQSGSMTRFSGWSPLALLNPMNLHLATPRHALRIPWLRGVVPLYRHDVPQLGRQRLRRSTHNQLWQRSKTMRISVPQAFFPFSVTLSMTNLTLATLPGGLPPRPVQSHHPRPSVS